MSVHEARLGQMLEVVCAAHRHQLLGAIALKALETAALSTPWMHHDTTPISL